MVKYEELAAQMSEAIEYLSNVELTDTPLRIDVCTVQLNPKKYFKEQVPTIRQLWKIKGNGNSLELAVYHFMRFYKAVKASRNEQEQTTQRKESVDKAPAAKGTRAKKPKAD